MHLLALAFSFAQRPNLQVLLKLKNTIFLALADKVNLSDIEKLAKQKLYIPNTVMDMVWMMQNFHAVIKFCFGPKAHSTVFLCEWADHIYENQNMYMTQHSSDPYFFGSYPPETLAFLLYVR
jgi:hypothetical protein